MRRPGQPLTAMMALLGAWVVARIFLWHPPFAVASEQVLATAPFALPNASVTERIGRPSPAAGTLSAKGMPRQAAFSSVARELGRQQAAPPSAIRIPQGIALKSIPSQIKAGPVWDAAPIGEPAIGAALQTIPSSSKFGSRFSAESWVLYRPGSRLAGGPLFGRYGASQAGGILRYRLSGRDSQAAVYLRSTAALGPLSEREFAAGVSARPLNALPFRLQAEVRARETGDIAPAAVAVSEIRPIALPLRLRAEPYFAAGYVAGKDATPFIDGMMRVDRRIAHRGDAEFRLGAGAWGGAQEGAGALDIGPSASLRGAVGGRPVVLSADYRVRVAGSVEPRSGVAVTLSAGF